MYIAQVYIGIKLTHSLTPISLSLSLYYIYIYIFIHQVHIPDFCPMDAVPLAQFAAQNFDVTFLPGPRCQFQPPSSSSSSSSSSSASSSSLYSLSSLSYSDSSSSNIIKNRKHKRKQEEEDEFYVHEYEPKIDPLQRWMRLCFAMLSEEQLVEGVKRLMDACQAAAK
jgi:hypothetical protein